MEKKNIINAVFLSLDIISLVCFATIVIWIRIGYTEMGAFTTHSELFEELLKESTDANIIRLYLSSHYIFIIAALALIVKERLRNKKVTLAINIIMLIVILFLTPVILAWTIHLAPIFQIP